MKELQGEQVPVTATKVETNGHGAAKKSGDTTESETTSTTTTGAMVVVSTTKKEMQQESDYANGKDFTLTMNYRKCINFVLIKFKWV